MYSADLAAGATLSLYPSLVVLFGDFGSSCVGSLLLFDETLRSRQSRKSEGSSPSLFASGSTDQLALQRIQLRIGFMDNIRDDDLTEFHFGSFTR